MFRLHVDHGGHIEGIQPEPAQNFRVARNIDPAVNHGRAAFLTPFCDFFQSLKLLIVIFLIVFAQKLRVQKCEPTPYSIKASLFQSFCVSYFLNRSGNLFCLGIALSLLLLFGSALLIEHLKKGGFDSFEFEFLHALEVKHFDALVLIRLAHNSKHGRRFWHLQAIRLKFFVRDLLRKKFKIICELLVPRQG